MENYKAKFMCSYGGKIQPRTHDNQLSYVGGHTKIIFVDRNIKFPAVLAKLSALSGDADVSFKYQLPGEDLDALISVTNDDDLDNMMLVYDHLYGTSATPARMRLFLFANSPLDSGPDCAQPGLVKPNSNVDFLFGLDNCAVALPPPAAVKFNDPAPPSEYQLRLAVNTSDRVVVPDPNVNHPLEVRGQLQRVGDCASSSFGPSTPGKCDVFISFRGEDTRTNFACHLYEALCQKNIETFIDYDLHKGDEISPSLIRAIKNSYISVVVFSENYASSKWCLEELVKILECRKEQGHVVIPVFYDIDPSHVRKQVGSYKEAFEKHLQNFMLDMNKVQKWKEALTEAADLAGWDSHSRSYRDDSELIQKIVKDVLRKLNYHYPPRNFKSLVGIDKNSAPLESLLGEACSIGIWGMGGIGKTTIARDIFDKYSNEYEGSCFLENVRERSGKYGRGLHDLRQQMYSELLRKKDRQNSKANSTFVEHRLRRQRNFIVLDDVSSSEQLKYLVGELKSYGLGSRIIITTRDKSVLESTGVEKIYKVEELDFQESLILFSLNAFSEGYPQMGYKELSRRAVVYCKGVPLALIVLGSFLHPKSENEWDSALKKLERIPKEEIQNVLRLSYDGLNDEEKEIFLDIACYFKGEKKEHVINILDGCGFFAVIGMRSLHDKALINICAEFVWMHDLIQEMGWEIVRQESIKNPGNRSRLWDFDDTYYVLKENKGTNAIEGIMLDMSQSRRNLCLSADTFKKMPNIRFLKFFTSSKTQGRLCVLKFPAGLKSFSNKLRYLEWHEYPLQSLPSNFCPEKLVNLRMPNGQFKRLWRGVQNLVNLKEVQLVGCQKLMKLPDFSEAQNLKSVDLSDCRSLRCVHRSILSLGTLEYLNLLMCVKLEVLESEVHLRSLSNLFVDGCSSLMKFSLSSEKIEYLNLMQTGVKVLHSSIGRFSIVKGISLDGLRLENLPNELSCLRSLEKLSLSNCGQVISKEKLHVIFDGLQSLRGLYLENCHHLFELPNNLSRLLSLQELVLDGSHVKRLPESIRHLSGLEILSLRGCTRLRFLPELPPSICRLNALNCTLLQTVAFSLTTSGPQEGGNKNISFQNCMNLDGEKFINSFHQYVREQAHGYELRRGREKVWGSIFRICYPYCRVPEWFTHRTKGASITIELSPPSNNYFGSLLCVVLSPCYFLSIDHGIDIRCRCYLGDGNMQKYSTGAYFLHQTLAKWDSDHVFMSYHCSHILKAIKADRVNNYASSSNNQKVTFEFSVNCGKSGWADNNKRMIKECGVYPLNAPVHRIKQMELALGMKTKRHRDILELEHTEHGAGVGCSNLQGMLPPTKKIKEFC